MSSWSLNITLRSEAAMSCNRQAISNTRQHAKHDGSRSGCISAVMSMLESSASNLATKVYNTRTAIHSLQQHVSWCPCPTAYQMAMPPVKRFQKQSKPCSCGTSHIGNCPAGRMTLEIHLALMWQNPDCLLLQHVNQQDGVIWTVPVTAIVPDTIA